jgi:hypothetical protein
MPRFAAMATVLPEPGQDRQSTTNKRSKKEIEHSWYDVLIIAI